LEAPTPEINKEASLGPTAEGVNLICTKHDAPAATPSSQELAVGKTREKSVGDVPVAKNPWFADETAVAPLFVTVNVCNADGKFRYADGNVNELGETDNPVGAASPTVKSAGTVATIGWKGAVAVTSPKRLETFAAGLFAIFKPAPATSTGAVPPFGVEAENSIPHTDPSPATPPAEFTQVDKISASVFS
jgi:hypothetical protein